MVMDFTLEPLLTYYFKKGHRIRIEISSRYFNRFARNLNIGAKNSGDN